MKRWREKEEEFRQHCYRSSSVKILARVKKNNCGNVIAEIGKKRIFFLVIMAMALSKMKKKKIEWNYGNVIAEKWEGKEKICCQNLGRNF